MVILSMNSKRSRRENVRLWEIGDLSAAFACTISKRNKGKKLGQNQRRSAPNFVEKSEHLQSSGRKKSDYVVYPTNLDDMLQSRENKDPNSFKPVSQFTNILNGSKLDFGTITRKSRLMRRRRQSPNSNGSLFGGPFISDFSYDMYRANCFEDSSEHKTPSIIKEASEVKIDDRDLSVEIPQQPNEFGSVGASYEENTDFIRSTNRINKTVTWDDSDVNAVKYWLEEIGFGNFAQMFEMHEVDGDALPLLTFEDLKEMGIVAVGPRRKLFTAIQQLKGSQ